MSVRFNGQFYKGLTVREGLLSVPETETERELSTRQVLVLVEGSLIVSLVLVFGTTSDFVIFT